MPRYKVTLTEEEQNELKKLIQKGGKGYRIRHAHILLRAYPEIKDERE